MQVDMWVALGPSYPFEASSVYLGFREVKGLLSSHIGLLTAKLEAAIGALVGREMVFDLHTCAREFLTEHNVDHTTFSMHDQMVKEQEEKRVIAERQARAREQAMARELRLREQNHMRDQKVLENEMRIAEAEREQRARELAQQEQERLRKLFGQATTNRNRRESEEGDSDWDGDEEDVAASRGGVADGASAVAGKDHAAAPASGSSSRAGSLADVAEGVASDAAAATAAASGPRDFGPKGRKKLRWKKLITQVCLHLNPRPCTLDPGP
jgi:NADH dehydrogenase/NADH:ubiquinone oxidoreductase subunit G